MGVVLLLLALATGNAHLGSVDDDYEVAIVQVWLVRRLVLAPQEDCRLARDSTQWPTRRVNDVPVLVDFRCLDSNCRIHGLYPSSYSTRSRQSPSGGAKGPIVDGFACFSRRTNSSPSNVPRPT